MADIENSINIFKDQQHQRCKTLFCFNLSITFIEFAVLLIKYLAFFRFEELLKEEKIFWKEIDAFDQKIDFWLLPIQADVGVPLSARICADVNRDSRNLPVEVMALETFLRHGGGPQGGWDKCDHQNFMKLWTKHNGKPSYRKEAKLYLPDKTEENIRLHEEWYLELCHLQEEKRKVQADFLSNVKQRVLTRTHNNKHVP